MTYLTTHHNAPRKAPRQSRSQMTVNAILDATTHIFIIHGYAKTNTNSIAEHAGVSIGSLYQYFPNKDAIIKALHQRHLQRIQNHIANTIKKPIDIQDSHSLYALIESIVQAHLLEPELHLKFDEIKNLEQWRPIDDPNTGQIQQHISQLIAKLPQLSPSQQPISAFMLMHTVHALVHGIVFNRPENVAIKTMIDEIVIIIERYLNLGR